MPPTQTERAAGAAAARGGSARPRGATARAAEVAWLALYRIHLGTRKPENWIQLFKFGLVGASGYLINLAVFALLDEALGVHHLVAAVLSFCVAITNNFILNRHWTFQARAGHAGFQAVRFFAVSVMALGVNLLLLYLLVDVIGAPELPSQALAVALAMPFNFIGNKLWTFGKTGAEPINSGEVL
jgi:putative flippase GtrA